MTPGVVGASAKAGHRLVGSLAVRLVRANKWPVTVEAARELGLTEGSEVTAVIKASDVMVAAD